MIRRWQRGFRVLIELSLFPLCIYWAFCLSLMRFYPTIARVNVPHAGNECAADEEATAGDHQHSGNIERVVGLTTELQVKGSASKVLINTQSPTTMAPLCKRTLSACN